MPITIWKTKKALNETNQIVKQHYELYLERCTSELTDLFEKLKKSYLNIPTMDKKTLLINGNEWDAKLVIPVNVSKEVEL